MMANYLLDIVILLTAAVVAVPLFRATGFGAVPGFLVAGMLVGPSGLALIDNVTEIGQILTMAGKSHVAVDYNSSLVLRERADGHHSRAADEKPDEASDQAQE